MRTDFHNVYEDRARADAYAELEFPGTYYLAYRDLPAILRGQIHGNTALDFGCGTGRSTRFLRELGFDVIGIDISEPMLTLARQRDPDGQYLLVSDGDLTGLATNTCDLILAAFTFDNIPTMEEKIAAFQSLRLLLKESGRIVTVVSTPEIYVNEWASFSTKTFPENRTAQSGEMVRIVMLDVEDRRPVEDILCTDEDYREVYKQAGLAVLNTYHPLAQETEMFSWVSETTIAPWAIYVLGQTQ
jgi:SAM-dependent methyltransferase